MDPVAQDPRQNRRRDRAVRMNQMKITGFELIDRTGGKRHAGAVSDEFCRIQARIADYRKRKDRIIRFRIIRRDNSCLPQFFLNDRRVVDDGGRDSVNGRREGVVDQAYVQFLIHDITGRDPLFRIF